MSNDNIKFLVQSIQKSPVITEKNFVYQEYQNILSPKILNSLVSVKDNLVKTKLQGQETQFREKADSSNKIIREMMIMFSNASFKKQLEKNFKTELTLSSVDIWYDTKKYFLKPHVDHASIKLSLQIYLDSAKHPGTCLHHDIDETPFKFFKYKQNHGYALLSSEKTFHSTEYSVQAGTRTSLYVRYQ